MVGATRQASVMPQRSSSALTWARLTGPSLLTLPSTMRTLQTPQPPLTQPAARATAWRELGDEAYLGSGQKTLMTDAGEYGLLDIRVLRFD